MSFHSALSRIGELQSTLNQFSPYAAAPVQDQSPTRSSAAQAPGMVPASSTSGTASHSGTEFEALMRVLSYAEDLVSRGASTSTSASSGGGNRTESSSGSAAVTQASSTQATGQPVPGARGTSVNGADVVARAREHLGVPYVWGGTTPRGFDCSGLVQYVFNELGVSLPRTTWDQQNAGRRVPSMAQAEPGDLLVTNNSSHIGIYIGDGKMLHAPRPGRSVAIDSVSSFNVVTIRRVVDSPSEAGTSSAERGELSAAERSRFETQQSGATS